MSSISATALAHIKDREGFRNRVYKDHLGFLTGGVGHKLVGDELKQYKEGDLIPQEITDNWLIKDAQSAYDAAVSQATDLGLSGNYDFIDALTSVNFQLGNSWWDSSVNPNAHRNTWSLLEKGEYLKAAEEVKNSTWFKQTPVRVNDFSNAIAGLAEDRIREDDVYLETVKKPFEPVTGEPTPSSVAPRKTYKTDPDKQALDPFQKFFLNERAKGQAIDQGAAPGSVFTKRAAPLTYLETLDDAIKAGSDQLRGDVYTFGAVIDYIKGEEAKGERKMNIAELYQNSAAAVLEPMGSFEQFLDEPTFDKFMMQALKGIGTVIPQAIASISTGLSGGLIGGIGKATMTQAAKNYTTKKTKDLVKKYHMHRQGKGPALTPLEKDYLQQAYQAASANKYYFAQKNLGKVVNSQREIAERRMAGVPLWQLGFWTGSFAQSEVVGASQSFQEFKDAGYELTDEEAKAALAIGVPQAFLDVIGEKVFYGMFFKTAAKDLVEGNMSAGEAILSVAKAGGKGFAISGAAEGLTEAAQEEIVIQQRFAIDPDYSEEEANLRRGEAAFIGAIAGGARGAPSNVIAKSYNLLFGPERQAAEDTDVGDGKPQEESVDDLKAQVKALKDGQKNAVWVPGGRRGDKKLEEVAASQPGLTMLEVETTEDGGSAGLLFVRDEPASNRILRQVKDGATDETLRNILDFTETQSPNHPFVIAVKDAKGNIIERQTVSGDNLTKAFNSAKRRYKDTPYEVIQQTKEEALADRATIEERKVGDEDTTIPGLGQEDIVGKGMNIVDSQGFYQTPRKKGSALMQVFSAPLRQEGAAPIDPAKFREFIESDENLTDSEKQDLINYFLSKDIEQEGKQRLSEVPKKMFDELQRLRKKYPTTAFTLVKGKEARKVKKDESEPDTIDVWKIKVEGELRPDIKIAAQDGVDAANKSLGKRSSKFSVDGKPVDINNLLENKELTEVRENFINNVQLTRDQFNDLLGSFALAGLQLEFDGKPILSASDAAVRAIRLTKKAKVGRKVKRDTKTPIKVKAVGGILTEERTTLRGYVERLRTILDEEGIIDIEDEQGNLDLLDNAELRDEVDRLSNLAIANDIEIGFVEGLTTEEIGKSEQAETLAEETDLSEEFRLNKARQEGTLATRMDMEGGDNKTYLKAAKKSDKATEVKSQFTATPTLMETFTKLLKGNAKTYIAGYFNLLKKLGYKRRMIMMDAKGGLPASVFKGVTPARKEQLQKSFEQLISSFKKSKDTARYYKFEGFDIIAINSSNITSREGFARNFLEISHEIGHAFLEQNKTALLNTPLGKLVFKDFEKAKARLEAEGNTKYSDPKLGFDEYFSDQLAIWVNKTNTLSPDSKLFSAGNAVESFFKRLVTKMKAFVDGVVKQLYSNRLSENLLDANFTTFIEGVQNSVANNKPPLSLAEKYQVAQEAEGLAKKLKKFGMDNKTAQYFKKKAISILDTPMTFLPDDKKHWSVSYLLKPAAAYLRGISDELAQAFYRRSVSEDSSAYLNEKATMTLKYRNQVIDLKRDGKFIFRDNKGEFSFDKFKAAARIAEDDSIATADITDPNAKALREWLDTFYDTYIGPSGIDIGKQDNFYTRVWDYAEILESSQKQQTLADLLREANPDVEKIELYGETFSDWESFVARWLTSDEQLDNSNVSIGLSVERQAYFKNINNKDARDKGLLLPPDEALIRYIDNTVKKVEYFKNVETELTAADLANPALKDILATAGQVRAGDVVNGHVATEVMLSRISDPIQRQGARNAVMNMIGKAGHDMSPMMRKLNSYGLLLNMITLLPFATIASVPDLGGSIIRSQGNLGFRNFIDNFKTTFKNYEESQQFARDLGLVTNDSIHSMYVNAYELGFMDKNSRAIADRFFKVIQLDTYTQFTRVFAAGMGERFLVSLARTKDAEKLNQLGLTVADVTKAYDKKSGQLNRSDTKIQSAIRQFVEESVIRPNAAERPVWANNPYTALVFQLKSFFYAFGTNIMGGVLRTANTAYSKDGKISSAAIPLAIAAGALMPLAMIGLELREFLKYLGRGVTPGFLERPLRGVEVEDTFTYSTAFRSNGMDWGEYLLEMMDRGGLFGPYTLLFTMADNAKYGDSFLTPAFGPTAERLEDLLVDGDFRFNDVYPF
jgi:GH24 family phage-related lysozyme (muramidase)